MSDNNTALLDPMLGEEVSVKDYTSSILPTEDKPKDKPTEKPKEPPVKPENKAGAKEQSDVKPETELPPPPPEDTNFGNDYDKDGVDSYADLLKDKQAADEQPDVLVPNENAELFAKMIVGSVAVYAPMMFVGVSKLFNPIKEKDILFHALMGNIPQEFATVYEKDCKTLEQSLQLSSEEKRNLTESLAAYAKYKSFKAANPETAFWGNVAMLAIRMGDTAISHAKQSSARWNAVFEKYGINPKEHKLKK